MSALATRAELVAEKDYYLAPLPRTGENADQIEAWIEEAVLGQQPLQPLTRLNEKGQKVVFARAYERPRSQRSKVADHEVACTERVQVIRSLELAQRQAQQLDERLCQAVAALRDLTPPVGRGHQQYREEEQIVGLTRLLTIGLRVLTLSELQVLRCSSVVAREKLFASLPLRERRV